MYLKSDQMPHREEDAVDPKSRHKVRCTSDVGGMVLIFVGAIAVGWRYGRIWSGIGGSYPRYLNVSTWPA